MKIYSPEHISAFEQIPNVGPRIAQDFRTIGITPRSLAKQDPLKMYLKLQKMTGVRHDPCVLDTFMAAVDFMNGAPPRPWWHYTSERKKLLGKKRIRRLSLYPKPLCGMNSSAKGADASPASADCPNRRRSP